MKLTRTSAQSFADLPTAAPELLAELKKSKLVIFKGDLNTRKLRESSRLCPHFSLLTPHAVSDARWPNSTPFAVAMGPLAGHFATLVLRTCKADVCAGLTQEKEKWVEAEDAKWRVNGKWAIVVYVAPTK